MMWHTEMHLQGSGAIDEARFDALADALAEIDRADPAIQDADLTASLAGGWALVAMDVNADDPADAIRRTIAAVRAAIQTIRDYTPGWERLMDLAPLAVRPADSRARCLSGVLTDLPAMRGH